MPFWKSANPCGRTAKEAPRCLKHRLFFRSCRQAQRKLGRVTLNVAATLNSLTLEMVDLLQEKLDAWRDDDAIAAVFIEGAGEKAFCAGGDVQALHQSAVGHARRALRLRREFLRARIPHELHPAHLQQTAHLLGPRYCDGRRTGCDGGVFTPGGDGKNTHRHAGSDHRPVPRCGRHLVFEPYAWTAQGSSWP